MAVDYILNDSTLRHLKKLHKDWSEEKIRAEANKIWVKYLEDNKDRLDILKKEDREAFDYSIDKEFTFLLLNKG